MGKVYFTSDWHFFHASILYFHPQRREEFGITLEELQTDKAYCVQKMNQELIKLWNSTVTRDDTVYFLGDFSFGNKIDTEKVLQQLKGKKFLIRGNHDKSTNGLEKYFQYVGDIKEAKFSHQQFNFIDPNETFCVEMCHYPLLTWNRRTHGTVMCHGHCHSSIDEVNKQSEELRVDIGLDSTLANYNFIELEQLYNYFTEIKTKAGCKTFQEYAEKLMNKQGYRA